MDFTAFLQGTDPDTIRVPSTWGRREFRISTGMFFSTAGMTVGRMQNFRAKVGQFRGFGKGDDLDPVAAGKNRGIGGQHAIDIGPDLDFLSPDSRAHDGCGEIRTAAAERGGDALLRRAEM